MRIIAALSALAVLGLCGCEKQEEALAEPEAVQVATTASVQSVSAPAGERYDFKALAAEGLARDKAVLDSGWRPRKPEPVVDPAAVPIFPTPAPATRPAPAAQVAVLPPVQQTFEFDGRGGRGGRGERGQERAGRAEQRGQRGGRGGFEQGFGGPGFGGPGPRGGFPVQAPATN